MQTHSVRYERFKAVGGRGAGGDYVNKICFYIEKMSYYPNAVADTANDDDLKPLNLTIKVNTLLKYPVVFETPFKASHGFTS